MLPPPFPQEKLPFNTTGILMPRVEARIIREDGTEADYDEAGELWITGENVALGYWENQKATSETFFQDEQGRRWLKTGDIFRVDKAGFFFFEDRMKVRSVHLPQSCLIRSIYSPSRILSKSMGCKSHPPRSKSRCWVILTASLSTLP